MFNLGPEKLIVLALVALVVLGPQRLPEAMRKLGKLVRDLRELSAKVQGELQEAFEEHTGTNPTEVVDTLRSLSGPLNPVRSGTKAALAVLSTQPAAPAQKAPAKKPVAKKAPAKKVVAKKAAAPRRVAS